MSAHLLIEAAGPTVMLTAVLGMLILRDRHDHEYRED